MDNPNVPPGDRKPPVQPAGGSTPDFRQVAPDYLEATEHASELHEGVPGLVAKLKHTLLGMPLRSSQIADERIGKAKALAVLSSDALSSVAYATEEILKVLAAAGALALGYNLGISGAIVALLAIVALSYRQTIYHYPKGGGTYIVTQDNLGNVPALIAGSSLMVDYTMTVAVSIASGVAAVTSAFPALAPWTVPIALVCVGLLTLGNLRGIRDSAALFALPTYAFIGCIAVVLGVGAWRIGAGLGPVEAVAGTLPKVTESVGLFLILRAFASGCSAMTGTEAISDGVLIFRDPQPKNAVATLAWMAGILGVMFMGIALLSQHFGILPNASETVLSQLVRASVGHSWFYYVTQAATALILILAANTAFSDFPRLSYFLARDNFLPSQFVFRGDRLSYSTGIIALGLLAAFLTLVFKASVDALIPLYAIGVFISFTFSQTAMAYRWWKRREPGWSHGIVINSVGALTTAVVAVVIMVTKFLGGAWMIMVLIPLMIGLMRAIRSHYLSVAEDTALDETALDHAPLAPSVVVVPIHRLTKVTARTLRYAASLSTRVVALHVADSADDAKAFRAEWTLRGFASELVILESPYRSLVSPILAYLDTLQPGPGELPLTVILSEYVPRHWWEWILHNQDALRLKLALFFKPDVVVSDMPYHLYSPPGSRKRSLVPPVAPGSAP